MNMEHVILVRDRMLKPELLTIQKVNESTGMINCTDRTGLKCQLWTRESLLVINKYGRYSAHKVYLS